MNPSKLLATIVICLAVCGAVRADDGVTIVSAPDSAAVHKTLNRKDGSQGGSAVLPVDATTTTPAIPSSTTLSLNGPSSITIDPPASPAVETGLPIARGSAPSEPLVPAGMTMQNGHLVPTTPPQISSTVATLPPSSGRTVTDNYVITDYETKKPATTKYPWKTNIITTIFWIGEAGSDISPTDNKDSAWVHDWQNANGGNDDPDDRLGYGPADHAARVNPFYVALPFNDLADPDKARRWLPANWRRPADSDGKPVSACKDRWVEIKNAQGRICYAQWEDVGPLEWDHAEYVFGDERPTTYTRAGLDVSPDVARYLGMDQNHSAVTSWRFVDSSDVPPGLWLIYDERALFYRYFHDHKNSPASIGDLSPVSPSDANKKKIGVAKG